MTTIDKIHTMQTRISEQRDHITTEQGTRNALVNPFIRDVLGYDPENVLHVAPELLTGKQVGISSDERADYALIVDGTPRIIIEAKKVNTPITPKFIGQLSKYVTAVQSVKYGIFTDGINYTFFGEFQNKNLMDVEPFMSFNLDSDNMEDYLDFLRAFHRETYDEGNIKRYAKAISQIIPLKDLVRDQLLNPTQEMLWLMKDLVGKPVSKEVFLSGLGDPVDVVVKSSPKGVANLPKSWTNSEGETEKLKAIFMLHATYAEKQEYGESDSNSKRWSMSVKVAERSGWERK